MGHNGTTGNNPRGNQIGGETGERRVDLTGKQGFILPTPFPTKKDVIKASTGNLRFIFELVNDTTLYYIRIVVKDLETEELTQYSAGNHDELRNISPTTHELIQIELEKVLIIKE